MFTLYKLLLWYIALTSLLSSHSCIVHISDFQLTPRWVQNECNNVSWSKIIFGFRTGNMVSPYEDKIGGNPIGLLQELCMSRRWPPPTYDTEHEEGLPHERQFTIACYIFKFKEIGKHSLSQVCCWPFRNKCEYMIFCLREPSLTEANRKHDRCFSYKYLGLQLYTQAHLSGISTATGYTKIKRINYDSFYWFDTTCYIMPLAMYSFY